MKGSGLRSLEEEVEWKPLDGIASAEVNQG
jgi:hypothetical protein